MFSPGTPVSSTTYNRLYIVTNWPQYGNNATKNPVLNAYLGEFALLVDECDDVHGLDGDHVQSLLVVDELYVRPGDGLIVILLLLQLEDVPHEELLKVLVGVVDTQLLKTNKTRRRLKYNHNIISDTTSPRVLGRI